MTHSVIIIWVLVTLLVSENAFFAGMVYKEKILRKTQPKVVSSIGF